MDVIAGEEEVIDGKALLREVMTEGHRTCPCPSLKSVREYCVEQLCHLPPALRSLEHVLQSPVKITHKQRELAAAVALRPHRERRRPGNHRAIVIPDLSEL